MWQLTSKVAAILMLAGALTVAAGGCGGSGSASVSSSETSPPRSDQSNTGNRSFLSSGNSIAKFGKEATAPEREGASRVVTRNFEARASHDFEAQCATMTNELVSEMEKTGEGFGLGPNCGKALAEEASEAPPKVLKNTLHGPLDALRTDEKGNAFGLYHGTNRKDWEVMLKREAGGWKVAALLPGEL